MPTGSLKINTTTGLDTIPVADVSYIIKDKSGRTLFSGVTNENGESGIYTLDAPPKELSLYPDPYGRRPYSVYDIFVSKKGYADVKITDVQIFDGQMSVQPIDMVPLAPGETEYELTFIIPPPTAYLPTPPQLQSGTEETLGPIEADQLAEGVGLLDGAPVTVERAMSAASRVQRTVIIPDYITVHLGIPSNSSATNVRVRFIDYVKNVTSSEIYPDWPVNSIIANVHCIVSFALNRVYTEWYRVRGYPFDITNSTTVDQYFVYGRNIYQNISEIVDGIFNIYARRIGFRNPYFTEYCNGTTATCKGLSQWGTVTLANQGYTPIQILRHYYGSDIELVTGRSGAVSESYPGYTLQLGTTGENVRRMQMMLNRIRTSYPAIPSIPNPNGVFDANTENSVRAFQRTFNLLEDGKIGRNTWNRISQISSGIIKLSELNGEGERIGLSPTPPTSTIRQGNTGADVIHAQFLLDFIAQFYSDINAPLMDASFGPGTTQAVRAFQRRFGLTADGVVGPNTWRRMYEVYRELEKQVPPGVTTPPSETWPAYPGVLLRRGSTGNNVVTLQQMLNNSQTLYPGVPRVPTDGNFGPLTENAVRIFQQYAGLTVDGIVGPNTWNALRAISQGGTTTPPAPGAFTGVVRTSGGNLNFRSGPNTSSAIIGSIPNGSTVQIIGEQNGFYQIIFGGQTGFASGSFISPNSTSARVSTQGGNLNLRSAPNTSSSVIASIPNGSTVTVLDRSGNFFRVNFNNLTGFASADFITLSGA